MKAAVYRQYGSPDVVHIEELPTPEPGADEVLIQVRASTVSSADWRARSLDVPPGFGLFARPVFGVFGPRKKVLGTELAGDIVAVGAAVTNFKVGDAVFAFPGFELGAHAEYRVLKAEGRIEHKPEALSYEEAAALCFGGTTALFFLRDRAAVRRGESVLVVGASGAVGSATAQIARAMGARVTGVTSTANVERVRTITDEVVDYTKENIADRVALYDVIVDTIGRAPIDSYRRPLKPEGRLAVVAAGLGQLLRGSFLSSTGKMKVLGGNAAERKEDLTFLKQLVDAGQYRPWIDGTYPLADIRDAHARVDGGHKRGSVVVTMQAR